MMKEAITLFIFMWMVIAAYSQRNCNTYLWEGDSCRYNACKYLEEAPSYFQLRKEFHDIYDEVLSICPEYSDAYRAKSIAYLKTGDFIQWKILIDKAVDIDPKEHLGYRGWCRFQFFRDYRGALEDLDRLESLLDYDIGYCQNGMYHLTVAKALCHKMVGDSEMAKNILIRYISENEDNLKLFDLYHLGVLHYEAEDYDEAVEMFKKQEALYSFAENEYFLAMTYRALDRGEEGKSHLLKAKFLYEGGTYMFDPYTHQVDKIYLADIEKALEGT